MKPSVGVYALFQKGKLVYIGKSNNLLYRIGTHQKEGVKEFDSYELFPVNKCNDEKLAKIEAVLIDSFKPKYNAAGASRSYAPVPIFGKANTVAYIKMVVKQMSECLCEDGNQLGRTFCLCNDCAYYHVNVDKNKRLLGRNKNIYLNKCPMDFPHSNTPMDGCSHGLPLKFADVYQDNSSLKEELILIYDAIRNNRSKA